MTLDVEMLKEMVKLMVYLQLTCKKATKTRNLSVKERKEVTRTIERIDKVFEQLKETKINESD